MVLAMDSQPPLISSFVIRFVMNEAQDELVDSIRYPYRGSIRHIQSEEEINFHLWDDAVAFIRRYVPLDGEKRSDGA